MRKLFKQFAGLRLACTVALPLCNFEKGGRSTALQVYRKSFKEFTGLRLVQRLTGHQGVVWTMKFSRNGKYLASGEIPRASSRFPSWSWHSGFLGLNLHSTFLKNRQVDKAILKPRAGLQYCGLCTDLQRLASDLVVVSRLCATVPVLRGSQALVAEIGLCGAPSLSCAAGQDCTIQVWEVVPNRSGGSKAGTPTVQDADSRQGAWRRVVGEREDQWKRERSLWG